MKDRSGTLLEYWRSPTGSGDPIGCLATTFTFDAGFFEEECLARFLDVDSLPDREGLAFLLERENRLGSVYAGVLVDQHQAGVDHSMRWDVLPVRISRGLQHAKITIMAWVEHVRILVSSANLTPQGYRTNHEVAGTLTLVPDKADKKEFDLCCSFFEDLIRFVPGDSEDPIKLRALNFIKQVRNMVASWKEGNYRKSRLYRHFVFTLPAVSETDSARGERTASESALMSCLEKCRRYGPAPAKTWVASPFFDPEDNKTIDEATRALCKGMGRGISRYLTFCVPEIGHEESDSLRLAAPKSLLRTGKGRVDHLRVEVLPSKDQDRNPRPWHAKMLWLESDHYSAMMIGSSNFTQAGLGLRKACNAEANLIFVTRKKSYARESGELAKCWPDTKSVVNPKDVKWTGELYGMEEDIVSNMPLLPAGFVSARYRAGDDQKLLLRFLPEKLPNHWKILAGLKHDEFLMDCEAYLDAGKGTSVEVSWKHNYAPGKLLVKWKDKQAFWPVNVEDQSALPIPNEVAKMSARDLMVILAAADSSVAFRAWCRQQVSGNMDDELDCALPAELDPLRRFDIRETFLHRIRRQARLLAAVRRSLERPAWSVRALDWRLRGMLGIERLGEHLIKELQKEGGKTAESTLILADFILMLTEVNYKEEPGWLTLSEFEEIFKPFVGNLAIHLNEKIYVLKTKLPPDIRAFWKEVYDRCRM